MRLLVVLLFVAGCDSGTQMTPSQRFLLERAEADVKTVKDAMAAGKSPAFACSTVEHAVHELSSLGLVKFIEWDQLCEVDAPVAYADALVKRLEAPNVADEAHIDDCVELDLTVEHLDLAHKDLPRVKSLHSRRKQLCP
jgi:hypothetical protein